MPLLLSGLEQIAVLDFTVEGVFFKTGRLVGRMARIDDDGGG